MIRDTQPPDYLFADALLAALKEMQALTIEGQRCPVYEDGKRCQGAQYSQGLCQKHYRRWAKGLKVNQ